MGGRTHIHTQNPLGAGMTAIFALNLERKKTNTKVDLWFFRKMLGPPFLAQECTPQAGPIFSPPDGGFRNRKNF